MTDYNPVQYPPPNQPQPGVAAKSPGIAVLLSFLIPGAGHLYANAVGQGLILLVLLALGWATTPILVGFFILPVVYLWAMIGSYISVTNFNRRNNIKVR